MTKFPAKFTFDFYRLRDTDAVDPIAFTSNHTIRVYEDTESHVTTSHIYTRPLSDSHGTDDRLVWVADGTPIVGPDSEVTTER